MKKILITGAGGFVGKYLIDIFKDDNYEVLACDINSNNISKDINYKNMNILDKEAVNKIIKDFKPDYLVNLAAISSVGTSWKIPDKTIEVNVIGTINLLEAVHENCSECKILLIGSSEEYLSKDTPLKESDEVNANNPYGISKIAQENFAKLYRDKYGMKIVCTRSFNHTGIGQMDTFAIPSFCKQVAEIEKIGKPGKVLVGNLTAFRDFSDVKDIVKVYKALLENETDEIIYNVGSGNAYKMSDLLDYIVSLSTQKIEIVTDKEKLRPVDTPYICCDNTKTKKFFDNTDIKDTIKEIYKYYLNRS